MSEQPTAADVVAFLNGTGELEGCSFGEKFVWHKGSFWWRKYLPLLSAPATLQVPVPAGARERVARIVDPAAWDQRERHFERATRCEGADNAALWDRRASDVVAQSLRIADAILALPVDGREVEGRPLAPGFAPLGELVADLRRAEVIEECARVADAKAEAFRQSASNCESDGHRNGIVWRNYQSGALAVATAIRKLAGEGE